jgi:hypothetical protein
MALISAFRQGFRGPDGVNYVAKLSSISRALMGFRRGSFLLYFG